MKHVFCRFYVVLVSMTSAPAFASLLSCETGGDAGVKASGTFHVTDKCRAGYALENPRTGVWNCLSVNQDLSTSSYDGMVVDVCVIDTGSGLVIVDMRPQGAE